MKQIQEVVLQNISCDIDPINGISLFRAYNQSLYDYPKLKEHTIEYVREIVADRLMLLRYLAFLFYAVNSILVAIMAYIFLYHIVAFVVMAMIVVLLYIPGILILRHHVITAIISDRKTFGVSFDGPDELRQFHFATYLPHIIMFALMNYSTITQHCVIHNDDIQALGNIFHNNINKPNELSTFVYKAQNPPTIGFVGMTIGDMAAKQCLLNIALRAIMSTLKDNLTIVKQDLNSSTRSLYMTINHDDDDDEKRGFIVKRDHYASSLIENNFELLKEDLLSSYDIELRRTIDQGESSANNVNNDLFILSLRRQHSGNNTTDNVEPNAVFY